MDWLRSEDLKEEKNVIASTTMITAPPHFSVANSRGGLARGHEPIVGYTEVEILPVVRYGKLGTPARRLHVNDAPRCISTKKALANYR